MNQDKDIKVEVRKGKEKKVKAPFKRVARLGFLACLPIYPGLAPAESCAGLHPHLYVQNSYPLMITPITYMCL